MTNVIPMQANGHDYFEDFWKAYPKRIGKPLAKAKWELIVGKGLWTKTLDKDSQTMVEIELHATPQEIIEGAKRYYKANLDWETYKIRDHAQFICHPATWLNQGRWMDE